MGYDIETANTGKDVLSGVTLTDKVDVNTTILAGSITVLAGTVTSGENDGGATLGVDVGAVDPGGSVTVAFRVEMSGLPATVIRW